MNWIREHSFKALTSFLWKDPTAISKEVIALRFSNWYHKGIFYSDKNFCIHRYHCRKTNACGKLVLYGIKCTSCPTCNQTCKDFVKERCMRLDRAPHIWNGCDKKITHCTIAHKYDYNARFADKKYREKLRTSRTRSCIKGAIRLIFDRLGKRMGTCEFASVLKYILSNRGSKFSNQDAPGTDVIEIQRSSIYYCDPMQGRQKGRLEQAHTILRMILPKGTSFEFLTQWDVNLIVNHINSIPRKCLGGRTPYSMTVEALEKKALNLYRLNLTRSIWSALTMKHHLKNLLSDWR